MYKMLFQVRSQYGKGMSIKVSLCISLEHIFGISGPTVLNTTIRTGEIMSNILVSFR